MPEHLLKKCILLLSRDSNHAIGPSQTNLQGNTLCTKKPQILHLVSGQLCVGPRGGWDSTRRDVERKICLLLERPTHLHIRSRVFNLNPEISSRKRPVHQEALNSKARLRSRDAKRPQTYKSYQNYVSSFNCFLYFADSSRLPQI